MVDPQVLSVSIAVLFSLGFALVAYGLKILDVPGSLLSFVLALVILLSKAGYLWLFLLMGFVLFGFIVTKLFWSEKAAMGVAEGKKGVRGWRNVAANGLVPAILAVIAFWVDKDLVRVGFVTAIATASSDTFASELGVLSKKTYLITAPWRRVEPGTNGGVSNWGHLVAFVGAALPTLVAIPLVGLPWTQAWIPLLAGWIGCQIDSVLGALFEEDRGRLYGILTKADVNFLSIATTSFSVLVILNQV